MHAYVLTRITGEPPLHKVGQGEPGSRIRAMAHLDGPDHNLFAALEVRDFEEISLYFRAESELIDAAPPPPPDPDPTGTVESVVTAAGTVAMAVCESVDCLKLIPDIVGKVSFIGTSDSTYCFGLLSVNGPLAVLSEVVASLGSDRVAAITDGTRVLVELVGTDRTELEQEMKRIIASPTVLTSSVSFSEGITRAAP